MCAGLNARAAAELWFVEGYATGLSVDAALKLLRLFWRSRGVSRPATHLCGRKSRRADTTCSRTTTPAVTANGRQKPVCRMR